VGLEQIARAVRHAPVLRRAEPVWRIARPVYDLVLAHAFARGLERTVNGTEPMRLDPRCRNVPTVYEPEVWFSLLNAVRPGDTFVDVGANIGLYAVAAARRVRPGKVIAFEPDAGNAELLARTVALNDVGEVVEVRRIALGAERGELPFRSAMQQSGFDARGTEVVPMSTLDSEIDGRVDVLKIDVEGFEPEVLAGAHSLLLDEERRPHTVFLESHPAILAARGLEEDGLLEQLERAGYTVTELSRDWTLTRNLVARIDSAA
jgi:FkbM family methyltransferase